MTNQEALETGIRFYNNKKYEPALELLLTINEDSVDTGELSYYLGLCYARLEKYDEALLHLEQVVTTHNDFLHLYQCRMLLAIIYSITERYSLAEYELRQLESSGFESAQVYSIFSYVHYHRGNLKESLRYLDRACEFEPENPNVLNSLGFVKAETGQDLDKAAELCKEAVRKKPDQPAYLDSLGWVYYKMGQPHAAKNYISRAFELSKGHKIIRKHLDTVLEQAGKEAV
ncbi:MAG: tetratricopeptide repeat protein [Spirochaetaceae bacterium]